MKTAPLLLLLSLTAAAVPTGAQEPSSGTVTVRVLSDSVPVQGAEVRSGATSAITDTLGEATLRLPAGEREIVVGRLGFRPVNVPVTVRAATGTTLVLELEEDAVALEGLVVTTTRTGQRVQDEPLRIEVIDREEIEELTMMSPGNIAMLLGETSGVRVQVSAPSLGGANIRIQGLRGRYTQILSDGLPLYGGQTGALGLLQIPPSDLGQVELLKGVASALYGPSALGGVINLISRRPEENMEHELLVNRTTREGTDAVLYSSGRVAGAWGYSALGGFHGQGAVDLDGDGWADLPGYRRGVLRPRVFWDDGSGSSLFLTVGGMAEEREGGTMDGRLLPDGTAFRKDLGTRRLDAGAVGRFVMSGTRGARFLNVRASAMGQRHRHGFGEVAEKDFHGTFFGEASFTGASGLHIWAVGGALQRDVYRSDDVPAFDHTHTVPSLFAQDDYALTGRLTLAASGRLDFHSEYGTFLSPRLSALFRPGEWTARASVGTGYYAPTPFTEETEAIGLLRLLPLSGLEGERARSASLDVGRRFGPIELNATVFGSAIDDALALRESPAEPGRIEFVNAAGPTRTAGTELLGTYRYGPLKLTAGHVFMRSTEADPETGLRRDVPLTPKHESTLVLIWEEDERGLVGFEAFHTGRQPLDDNPFRLESDPYLVLGVLAQWKVTPWGSVFVNFENLTDVRQTRHDPLVRPARAASGRWAVDAWAPLEGRIINAGMRAHF